VGGEQSALHASPAKRAQLDAARLAARAARRAGGSPGPGAYDVRRPTDTSAELAGSTAFKSKSASKGLELPGFGDPGAYSPKAKSLVKQTYNKEAAVGGGGFGSRARREGVRDFKPRGGDSTPSPTAYSPPVQTAPDGTSHRGSAFSSQTKRGAYVSRHSTPGAGEYVPSSPQQRTVGGDSMFRGKDVRFKKNNELEYTAHVGPGTYAQEDMTLERKLKGAAAHGVSSSFASTSLRDGQFLRRGQSG
jgi:hypothetical protein